MSADKRCEQGAALMTAGQWAAAVETLAGVAGGDEILCVQWNLGWAYFQMGQFRAARAHLEAAVRLAPTAPTAHWALGTVLLKAGLFADAEGPLRAALALRDATVGRLSLALTLMHLGRFEEAEMIHTAGIRQAPDCAERLEAYADFLDDTGCLERANEMRRQAAAVGRLQ